MLETEYGVAYKQGSHGAVNYCTSKQCSYNRDRGTVLQICFHGLRTTFSREWYHDFVGSGLIIDRSARWWLTLVFMNKMSTAAMLTMRVYNRDRGRMLNLGVYNRDPKVYAHLGVYNQGPGSMLTLVFITGTGVYAHLGVYNRDRGLCSPWCL